MKTRLLLLGFLLFGSVGPVFAEGGNGHYNYYVVDAMLEDLQNYKDVINKIVSMGKYNSKNIAWISELVNYARTKDSSYMKYVEEARLWAAYLNKTEMYHFLYCASISNVDDYKNCKYKGKKLESFLGLEV